MKSEERPSKPSSSRGSSGRATRAGTKRKTAPGSDPRIGKVLGPYEIKAILGRGGMGIVYLAEHKRLGRDVALKVMSPELSNDDEFRKRFERESTLAAHLDHPNIVQVHDAGTSRGLLYLAMQLVSGKDLRQVLDKEGALDPARGVSIITQIASGLDEAHAEGLIHRDVKPANILLTKRRRGAEHAYLTDFGLAKRSKSASGLTRTGYYVGTMSYSAPEQFEGKVVDARSDIYSLGCVLFECLTGRAPFERDQELAVIYAHLHEEPPRATEVRPDLPAAVDEVLANAMAKDPDQRFPDCGELVASLQALDLSGMGNGEASVPPAAHLVQEVTPPPVSIPPAPPPPPPPPAPVDGNGHVGAPSTPPAPSVPPNPSLPPTPGVQPDASTEVPVPIPSIESTKVRPAAPTEPGKRKTGRRGVFIAVGAAAAALIAVAIGFLVLRDDTSPTPGPGPNPAVLSAEFTSDCTGLRCTFAPSGDVAGLSTSWSFGDGSPESTEPTPTHVYESVGDYQVSLHVADSAGGSVDQKLAVAVTLPNEDRSVSLSLDPEGGKLAVSGRVESSATDCVNGAQVVVERKTGGGWDSVGQPIVAGGSGRFEGTIPDDPGTYRASVPETQTETAACGGATSKPAARAAPSAPSSGSETGTPSTGTPSTGTPSSGGDEDVFGDGGGGGGGGDDVFGDSGGGSGGGGGGGGGCSGLC